ncbi:MAG: AmmeMemoRadiSam system protein B [Candidatus Gracilibacteria bacterium]|nr:AmmeMemoRadiSam system protein B [Candidatus Gracilibacteria bacterium]
MLSRKMSFAGMFYPGNKIELKKMIDIFFDNINEKIDIQKPKALVCPHAGYIYSGQVASYSYELLQRNLKNIPKTIVLLCPTHYVNFFGVSVGSYEKLKTPFGDLEVDKKLAEKLLTNYPNYFVNNFEAQDKEHSLEVQLPFLKYILQERNVKILPLIFGQINPLEIGEILSKILKENEIFFIVSSDLSHYNSYEVAKDLDKKTINSFISKDINNVINEADACGIYPWLCLEKIAILNNWNVKLLKYQNSGDTAGDKQKVVGYSSLVYY